MNAAVKATARGNNKKHSTHKPLKVWHFCWLTLQQCLFSKIGNQAVLCVYTQLCLTRCDPMVCSLSGSSVHGILQARILEWVAISFSRGSSWPRNQTQVSCIAGRFFNNRVMRKALNNGIHVPFSILVSSGYMPRSGIAGSYGGFIRSFFFFFF